MLGGLGGREGAFLTGEAVQLPGESGHNDVVLHDVCHLILQVVLIESNQGIRAGIPNLNERPIIPAVPQLYPYIRSLFTIYRRAEAAPTH